MVTGAPKPGGYRAPAPGGVRGPAAGGLDLSDPHLKSRLDGYPDAYIPQNETTAAMAALTRTVFPRTPQGVTVSSYAWTLPTKPGGSVNTLSNETTATVGFTPDVAGVYIFQCVVTFSNGVVVTRTTKHTAT